MKANQTITYPSINSRRLFYARKGEIPGSFLARQDSRALKQLSRGFFLLCITLHNLLITQLPNAYIYGSKVIHILTAPTTTIFLFRGSKSSSISKAIACG